MPLYFNHFKLHLFTFAVAGLVILIAGAAYLQVILCFPGDKGWLLLAAKMWLQGKTLYVDIFESNPPLIVWIYALPSFIALHCSIEDFKFLGIMTLCLIALSAWVSAYLIANHPIFEGKKLKQALFALIIITANILCTYSPISFADRDHLFAILTLPYIVRFMPSVSMRTLGWKLQMLISIMAGIGFCIKPHCLIIWIGINLFRTIRARNLYTLFVKENFYIWGVLLLYLLSICIFAPAYIHTVFPMALVTYGSYSIKQSSLGSIFIALITVSLSFVDFRPHYTSAIKQDIFYLLFACILLLIYALCNNGWGYTYTPLYSMLMVLNGFMGWGYLYLKHTQKEKGKSYTSLQFGVRACAVNWMINTFIGLSTLYYGYYAESTAVTCVPNSSQCSVTESLENSILKYHAHSFGTLTMNGWLWPYIVRDTGAQFKTRFNHLWMLPKLATADDTFLQNHAWISQYLGHGITEDILNHSPDVIFVDNSPYLYPIKKYVNIPEYISNHFTPFKAAWAKYSYAETVDKCALSSDKFTCRYDIYVNKKIWP